MTDLNRRDLIRLGLAGLSAAPLSGFLAPLHAASRLAVPGGGNAKLLVIFQRGASDGVTTCVPVGDPTYPTMRINGSSQAYIDPAATLKLRGSDYARMNPVLAPLLDAHDSGDVAWLHQVGNPAGLRSHFTEQQILETADPQPEHLLNEEGWVARLAIQENFKASTAIPTCSHSTLMQRAFQTHDLANQQVHIRALDQFVANGIPAGTVAHLASPAAVTGADLLVAASGQQVVDVQQELAAGTPYVIDPVNFPTNPAGLPASAAGAAFMLDLNAAWHLLAETSCRVVGVEIGGWDTHQNQQAQQDVLLAYLAYGLNSVYQLSKQPGAPSLVQFVITEFGRTAAVNGNSGTDHGIGSLMLAIGAAVRGGIYNCHGGTGLGALWTQLGSIPPLGSGDPNQNACYARTHFLAVYAEILTDLFGITSTTEIETILPGLVGASGPEYQPLDFLT